MQKNPCLDDEPMREEKPAVFVFGRTINALAIIRSIGSRGVRTVMVDSHPDEIAFYSRFCDQKVRIHEMSEDPELVLHELIDAAGKQDQRPVLLCTRDEYLVFLSKYQTILQDHFIFSLPEPDMVSTIIDKRLLAQFALQRGIPHPRAYAVHTGEEAAILSQDLCYPVIIKPPASHKAGQQQKWMGQKLLIAHDHFELLNYLEEFGKDQIDILIQEQIPGPETDIFACYACFSRDSRPLAMMTLRKLRQYPIHFGYGCAEQSDWVPEVAELGVKVFTEMKYRGMGGVEFKCDARDGIYKMIEIDGRAPMNVGIAIASGVDLPWIAYCDLAGEDCIPTDSFKKGVKWFFFEDDLAAYLQYRSRNEITLKEWVKTYRGRKSFATLSCTDPLPFLVSITRFLKGIVHSNWHRIRRKLSLQNQHFIDY